MRTCTACNETKPPTAFFKKTAKCKPCHYEAMRVYRRDNWDKCYETRKRYRARNPERMAELTRKSALKTRYGLTPAEYEQMFAAQGGACAICGTHPAAKRRLCVDHSHKTGKPRALLCDPCNAGLGAFRDSPELLRKAAEFIGAAMECLEENEILNPSRAATEGELNTNAPLS